MGNARINATDIQRGETMSDGRGQEYLDEDVCLHEDLYVDTITVKITSKPYGDRHDGLTKEDWLRWQKYLGKHGTELFDMYAEVVCEKCGATQEQWINVDEVVYEGINVEWIE